MDLRGLPATELPEWGGVVRCEGLRFILHLPMDFEINYCVDEYVIVTSYGPMTGQWAVGEGPLNRRLTLPSGGVFMAPPKTPVRAKVAEPVEFLVMAVEAERFAAAVERTARARAWTPALIAEFVDPGVAAIARELRRSLLSDPLREPSYLEALGEALMARLACKLLGDVTQREPREGLAPATLRRLCEHIETHLDTDLSVAQLAHRAGWSRAHFSRAFQVATGLSPQDFILARRICRARDQLAATDRPIADIAAEVGFSSQAHLSTAFKKRLGLSPARYRAAFRPPSETPRRPEAGRNSP